MKNSICLLFSLLLTYSGIAQEIMGAWEMTRDNSIKTVLTFTDGYFVRTTYHSENGEFIGTSGGAWELQNNQLTEIIEFDSNDAHRIGNEETYVITITDETLVLKDTDIILKRVDNGTPGDLNGAWLMSARVMEGKIQNRDMDNPRKTMKILSGTLFQWIAYNTETKEFMATGGGTYTTVNGKYTENIQFFSKDPSRVGMELEFIYGITEDGDWHHRGRSTKGDPIDEIWSLRP